MNCRLCLVLTVCSLVIVGCPKKPDEPPAGDPKAMSGDATAAPTQAPEPITVCDNEPPWLAMTPCRDQKAVFVKASVKGTTAMARQMALRHARAELTKLGLWEKKDTGEVTLLGSEAFDTFACGEQTYGLARMVLGDLDTQEIPACASEILASTAPAGECPAWVRRGAWKDGEDIVAVGFVSGLTNKMLAMSTVKNRAMAEARHVVACDVEIKDAGIVVKASGTAPGIPKATEIAECDGGLYAKVVFGTP